ncbi:hypothetical protein UFOVP1490_45, partial [uncultured Caudovirales phage]
MNTWDMPPFDFGEFKFTPGPKPAVKQ